MCMNWYMKLEFYTVLKMHYLKDHYFLPMLVAEIDEKLEY